MSTTIRDWTADAAGRRAFFALGEAARAAAAGERVRTARAAAEAARAALLYAEAGGATRADMYGLALHFNGAASAAEWTGWDHRHAVRLLRTAAEECRAEAEAR